MSLGVLFVDDEPRVLAGLRRMLRPVRRQWDLQFAESGGQALEILAGHPCQVIVSDMRMPGMDGVQLLDTVKEQYPHMVRIVLSGQSEQEKILRSLGPTHRYLAKPCDSKTLVATIEEALKLRRLLADERLQSLVARTGSVPSLPSAYLEIIQELNSPEPSIHQVAAIVSRDASMAAKTLQVVNSAYFGAHSQISDVTKAISRLGLEIIKALALSVHVFQAFQVPRGVDLAIEPLWQHSFAVSLLAKQIAASESGKQTVVDTTQTAGLLHDLGKLILAANIPNEYAAVLLAARTKRSTAAEAEQEEFGVTHAEVGAYLAGLWGLPDDLVGAMAYHHRPSEAPGRDFSPVIAVHVADALVYEDWRDEPRGLAPEVDMDCLQDRGLADRLPAWRALRDKLAQRE